MSFWSTEKVLIEQSKHRLVYPFKDERVKCGAYEMGLGADVFVTSRRRSTKQVLREGEQIAIPPGQFCLLMTEESVDIPLTAIAFISIKSSIKFRGLVNVSGFHVDPGFHGRLKYSVFNAGSEDVILQRGEAAFLIWFCDLDQETKKGYDGAHNGQTGLTSADTNSLQGEIASPGSLKRRLDRLDRRFLLLQGQIALLLSVAAGLLVAKCGSP